ncbi:MAG: DUF3419 family protein [Candidatus Aminicenantes bacterium]|nr:DUF3419 family protein [Candidatus Aminicenantes bacterium]
MRIYYSQCWEDPKPLMQSLAVTPEDDVFSIASGGDNTFALLLKNPRSLTAIDRNPAQISLVELKMRAIELLDYDDFIGFIGARPSKNREQLYSHLRPLLSQGARGFWDMNFETLHKGIIHCGKFDRYFKIFRQFVLPLIHNRKTVTTLLGATSTEEQEHFYNQTWNNRRWQGLFRIFFGKFLLGRLGKNPSNFRYVTLENIAEEIMNWTRYGLTKVPIHENYFVEYIMTGRYSNLDAAHPYLQAANFLILKERVGRMQLVCESLADYLKSLKSGSVSKFNLSDIFEYMSDEEVESTLQEMLRVSRHDSRLAFWTLFVPRPVPSSLNGQIIHLSSESEKLYSNARTFFYGSFDLWKIKGRSS